MSFLDQLSKSIGNQTNFFTQLSNISKNSRLRDGQMKLDLKLNTSSSVEKKSTNEVEEKEDFKVEKQDYFKTAKKVFKDYTDKVDKKSDKKNSSVKDEIADADSALDYIFGIVDPQLKLQDSTMSTVDLSAALEVLEVKEATAEPDPELLDFFLGKIDKKLTSEIENLTKEIVRLDLNTEDGVSAILELANTMEKLQSLAQVISELQVSLEALLQQDAQDTKLQNQTDLELYLDAKIEAKISQLKNNNQISIEPDASVQVEESNNDTVEIKKVLDELKASLKQDKAIKSNHDKLHKQAQEDMKSNLNMKIFKETDTRVESSKDLKYSRAEVDIISVKETSSSDTENSSDFKNDNFQTFFVKDIKASDVKVKTLAKPIAIKNIAELINKEATSLKTNTKQEIRMILDPENLGKMHLSMTREDNQIHISMVVRTDEAATKLEQKINDIKLALKDKGFEANIEVNKSDANNSNQQNLSQGQSSNGNEAKEEQKEKYLNQVPEWLSQDLDVMDFDQELNKVL